MVLRIRLSQACLELIWPKGRAHLDDVLAEVAAGKGHGSNGSAAHVPPSVAQRRRPPLPVGELVVVPGSGLAVYSRTEVHGCLEARPRHVGVGALQDQLEAARCGMVAAAVHDPAAVDAFNPDCADGVVAVRRRLRLRRSGKQQEVHRRGRREGRQSGEGAMALT